MELQLSWPSGYYSLFGAKNYPSPPTCPQGTGFQWRPGSITDQNHIVSTAISNLLSPLMIGIEEIGETEDWENFGGVKYEFCTKTEDPGSQYFSQDWPKGRYCILRKSRNTREPKCPRSKFDLLYYCWWAHRIRRHERRSAGHFLRLNRNRKPRMKSLWHPGYTLSYSTLKNEIAGLCVKPHRLP